MVLSVTTGSTTISFRKAHLDSDANSSPLFVLAVPERLSWNTALVDPRDLP